MKTKFFLSLLAVLLAFGAVLNAQVTKGSLAGEVVDQTGAAVEAAQVKATETLTGAVLNTTSDKVGAFRFNLIPPGNYTVEITKQGFKKAVAEMVVTTGTEASIGRINLAVGSTETEVSVVAESGLINTEQAQVANSFATGTLSTFSSLGDNQGLDRLAQFVPGVTSSRAAGMSNTNGGDGFSVNGLRGRNNDQQIDGQNNNDNSVGGPSTFVSSTEWIAEYNIVTNNFGPEYGRNAGSVVNVVTKSGTNTFHGSGYWSYNADSLNALNNIQKNFDGLTSPPSLSDLYAGYSLGGPVIKNRLFFFSGYDTERAPSTGVGTSSISVPTQNGVAQLQNCYPNSAPVAALAKYGPYSVNAGVVSSSNLSTMTIGTCDVEFAKITRSISTDATNYNLIEKIDWNGDKDRFNARYLYQNFAYNNVIGSIPLGYAGNEPSYSHNVRLGWTRTISNRMTNDLALTFSRMHVDFGGGDMGTIPSGSDISNAISYVSIGGKQLFGPSNTYPQTRTVNTWQIQDNWNYTVGRHNLKAGINWTYQRSPNVFLPNVNGSYNFADWASFAANTPASVSIAVGNPNLDFREYDTFAYVGDDWKVTPNLTINAGLTWTFYGQPANLFYNNDLKREQSADHIWDTSIDLADRISPKLDSSFHYFGPSIGFAYAPHFGFFKDGKTVVRGGYRLAFDPPFYNIYLNMASSAPQVMSRTLSTTATYQAPGMVSDPTGPNTRASLASYLPIGTADPRTATQTRLSNDFGADNVNSWSFGVQREITKSVVIEARYVGNHGARLFQSINGNPYIADLAADYPSYVGGLTPCANGRVICDMGVVRIRQNSGYSDYNGLQTELRTQQLFKQLSLRAAYTWSKTTDNVSEIYGTGDAGATTAFAQNPLAYTGAEHAVSGLDVPNKFTFAFVEELPFMRKQQGVVGKLLGGWGTSVDYVLASGQPYTPMQYYFNYATGGGNYSDISFNNSFAGFIDNLRPFVGNPHAPVTAVGYYDGGQLYDWVTGNPVTTKDVRFIMNNADSQAIFGTPFGNAARNSLRDSKQNMTNIKIFKNTKFTERVGMEFHVTMLNAFNHRNFEGVDTWLEDLGDSPAYYDGFGQPNLTNGGARTITFGGKISF